MKIKEYPRAMALSAGDAFIVDNDDEGTRYINQEDLPWGEGGGSVPATEPTWVSHRNTYRGKDLGNVYTDEQKAAVASGTFDDLYIGDYWTIGNFDWLIADINYWYNTGQKEPSTILCTTPHLVIVPRTGLYQYKMNDTNTAQTGYLNSKMYKEGLIQAKTIIKTAFGEDYILSHKSQFVSSTSDTGCPNGVAFVDSTVDLMNQIMAFGGLNYPYQINTGIAYAGTCDSTQLSLYRLRRDLLVDSSTNKDTALRDTAAKTHFINITSNGEINSDYATSERMVRPVFGLIGSTS